MEVTNLTDEVKKYELGIGDIGEMSLTFAYENKPDSAYRKLKALGKTTAGSFTLEFPDGTKFAFDAYVNVKINGGGVNAHITITAELALKTDITVTDPQ